MTDDRDFRIRLSKQYRSSDGTYHDTQGTKSKKKFFHDTLNDSMGEDAYLYNAYSSPSSTPTSMSTTMDKRVGSSLVKSKESYDLLNNQYLDRHGNLKKSGHATHGTGQVTWGDGVRDEEEEAFMKPFKHRSTNVNHRDFHVFFLCKRNLLCK